MFEHPYLTRQVTDFDEQRRERAAALRRTLIEHADQIVPRRPGVVRRLLRRLVPARAAVRAEGAPQAATGSAPAAVCTPVAAR